MFKTFLCCVLAVQTQASEFKITPAFAVSKAFVVTAVPAEPQATTAPRHIVAFTAVWCGPCRAMKPILEAIKVEGVQVDAVDIEAQPEILGKYPPVKLVPTYMVVENGKVLARITGSTTIEQMRALYRWKKPAKPNP